MNGKEDTEKKPCIYGETVHPDCSVRRELNQPQIEKYVKPDVQGPLSEVADATRIMMSMTRTEIGILNQFCEFCPYRLKYLKSKKSSFAEGFAAEALKG